MSDNISHLQIQQQILDWIDDDMDVDIASRKIKIDLNLETESIIDEKYQAIMESKRVLLDSFNAEFKNEYQACSKAINREVTEFK